MSSKMPPGPRDPSIVQALRFVSRPYSFTLNAHERYGDQWTMRLPGGLKYLVVGDPQLAKQVMSEERAVLSRGQPPIARPMFGDYSLFMLEGAEHAAHRRIIEPALRGARISRYDELTKRICEQELATIPLNEPIALMPHLREITLKTIVCATFGTFDEPGPAAVATATRNAIAFSTNLINLGRVWLAGLKGWKLSKRFVRMRAEVDAAIYAEIGRARDDPRLPERDDILSDLVRAKRDDGTPMSDREIRDELVTMMIQGHGSTASAIGWAIERLLRHPAALERLRAEVETGGEEYLNAVIRETLRVRPPLAQPTRKVEQPYTLGEYDLEPGTLILMNLIKIHRQPSMYPEPERFNPDRFVGLDRDTVTWIPFGGGVWGCPGAGLALQELRGILPILVSRARFGLDDPSDEAPMRRGVNLEPARGARVIVKERIAATGLETTRIRATP